MTFGKRFAPPSPSKRNLSISGNLAEKIGDEFEFHNGLPWEGADYAPCNYAVGHLAEYLWTALSNGNQKPHPETLFAAIGCVAGFANQKHVFMKLRESGYMIAPPAIDTIQSRSGIKLYTGTALSVGLIKDRRNKQHGLEFWPIILGAALEFDIDEDVLPSLDSMKKHVQEQAQTPKVKLRVGMYEQPKTELHMLLKAVWPLAEKVFSGQTEQDSNFGRVNLPFMCAICGYVVQAYMQKLDGYFPAGIALTIAMEAALYASQLPDPVLD